MAIDSFVMGNSPRDELIRDTIKSALPQKSSFRTLSGKEPFSDDYICRVTASDTDKMTAALIELSFRYAAKIVVAVSCDEVDYSPIDYSVAEKSIDNMKQRLSTDYYEEVAERYDYAAMKIQDFIEHGEDNYGNIIQHCWFLAKLDVCYRQGVFPSDVNQFFTPADSATVKELFELINLFHTDFLPKIITPYSKVVFNPDFGYGECLVGEVDCDMIVDSSIVDLRTGLGVGYPKTKVIKSLTYEMLTEINKECNEQVFDIDTLIFYSARYGEIEVFSVEEIPTEKFRSCVEKMMIVTEARYKNQKNPLPQFVPDMKFEDIEIQNSADNTNGGEYVNISSKPHQHSTPFADTIDITAQPPHQVPPHSEYYDDGYNQVVPKQRRKFIRKLVIIVLIFTLIIVGVLVVQRWYADNVQFSSFKDILNYFFSTE